MIKLIKSTFYNETVTKQQLTEFITKAPILSFGEQCQLFEKKFSKYQSTAHTVFVNSGSSANLAIIQALINLGRLEPGDNVAFSAITWSTNVMPLIQLGLNPVPVDVELDTLNVSSKTFQGVIDRFKIKAFFVTNLLGFCDDLEKIKAICDREGIILLEDNCESLGTVYQGKKLGNYGLASTFSFYVGHHMSTIEGGAVCTNDEELATMLHLVRAHGWDRNLSLQAQENIRSKHKINSSFYSRYTFYELGYNFRPTEINGFLGCNQLSYIDEIVHKRQKNFSQLAKVLYKNENYYKIKSSHLDFLSNFAFPLVCKSQETRNKLVQICTDKVEIRPIVGGDMTKQPFFEKYVKVRLPLDSNAAFIHDNGLYFGNNPELSEAELETLLTTFSI